MSACDSLFPAVASSPTWFRPLKHEIAHFIIVIRVIGVLTLLFLCWLFNFRFKLDRGCHYLLPWEVRVLVDWFDHACLRPHLLMLDWNELPFLIRCVVSSMLFDINAAPLLGWVPVETVEVVGAALVLAEALQWPTGWHLIIIWPICFTHDVQDCWCEFEVLGIVGVIVLINTYLLLCYLQRIFILNFLALRALERWLYNLNLICAFVIFSVVLL